MNGVLVGGVGAIRDDGIRIWVQNGYTRRRHLACKLGLILTLDALGQVKVLKEMRNTSTESNEMKESFAATVQGIAAGMGWTG